eukprot:scaffold8571_cov334-Pinguiococcus_pyrenoidosus.AAC.1
MNVPRPFVFGGLSRVQPPESASWLRHRMERSSLGDDSEDSLKHSARPEVLSWKAPVLSYSAKRWRKKPEDRRFSRILKRSQ